MCSFGNWNLLLHNLVFLHVFLWIKKFVGIVFHSCSSKLVFCQTNSCWWTFYFPFVGEGFVLSGILASCGSIDVNTSLLVSIIHRLFSVCSERLVCCLVWINLALNRLIFCFVCEICKVLWRFFLTPDTRLGLVWLQWQFSLFLSNKTLSTFFHCICLDVCVCLYVLNFPIFTVHMSLGESEINLKWHRISPKLNLRTGVFYVAHEVVLMCSLDVKFPSLERTYIYSSCLSLTVANFFFFFFFLPLLLNVPPSRMKIIESS